MSRNRPPHIQDVQIPDLPLSVLGAAASEGLGAAVEVAASKVDLFVTFSDGSTYRYPDVPALIALQLYADRSEDSFSQVRYWPGYARVAQANQSVSTSSQGGSPPLPIPDFDSGPKKAAIVARDPRTGEGFTQWQLEHPGIDPDVLARLVPNR